MGAYKAETGFDGNQWSAGQDMKRVAYHLGQAGTKFSQTSFGKGLAYYGSIPASEMP